MYVGVDLEAAARHKGPRPPPKPPQLDIPEASDASKSMRRSHSFTPPSNRLTQPTKSSRSRSGVASGSQSPHSSRSGAPGSEPKRRPQSARLSPGSPFGTPGLSSRSRPPSYTARLSAHEKTHSPSGRFHPDALRRREIRQVDMHNDIDYYAPHGAPDNDRNMKEASWLCSQAFIESLRVYPDAQTKRPITLPGECVSFSGNTQSGRRPHTEHVETAMRRRLSIAPADPDWLPEQLPQQWPLRMPEGEWRSVGPLSRPAAATSAADHMSKYYRTRTGGVMAPGSSPGRSGMSSVRGGSPSYPTGGTGGMPAGNGGGEASDVTSPAAGGGLLFNR